MLDDRTGTSDAPADDPLTGEFVWTRSQNRMAWEAVRGTADLDAAAEALLAPARNADLSRLPPTALFVGTLDLFRPEVVDYADRLMRSGTPTELHVFAGGVHAFDMLPGEPGTRMRAEVLAAVRRLC